MRSVRPVNFVWKNPKTRWTIQCMLAVCPDSGLFREIDSNHRLHVLMSDKSTTVNQTTRILAQIVPSFIAKTWVHNVPVSLQNKQGRPCKNHPIDIDCCQVISKGSKWRSSGQNIGKIIQTLLWRHQHLSLLPSINCTQNLSRSQHLAILCFTLSTFHRIQTLIFKHLDVNTSPSAVMS